MKLVGHDGTNATLSTPDADANMTLAIVGGRTIRVNIDAHATGNIVVQYGTGTGDFQGMVQHNAQANVDIQGRFKTGTSGDHPVMDPVSVRILNVAASSGTARITTPSNSEVEAGSDDNTIRIQFTADGTMDGGRVRLHTPDAWGELDERASDPDKNHIEVVSSSVVSQADISYGIRHVLVPITAAGRGSTVTFVLTNVKAQPTIGLARFTIESAGGPG